MGPKSAPQSEAQRGGHLDKTGPRAPQIPSSTQTPGLAEQDPNGTSFDMLRSYVFDMQLQQAQANVRMQQSLFNQSLSLGRLANTTNNDVHILEDHIEYLQQALVEARTTALPIEDAFNTWPLPQTSANGHEYHSRHAQEAIEYDPELLAANLAHKIELVKLKKDVSRDDEQDGRAVSHNVGLSDPLASAMSPTTSKDPDVKGGVTVLAADEKMASSEADHESTRPSSSMDMGKAQQWKPYVVCQMPTSPRQDFPALPSFSWEFLRITLGGDQWSPGFYYTSAKVTDDHSNTAISVPAYWMLDSQFEPFIPKEPGQHGAKLTAIFHPSDGLTVNEPTMEDYHNIPVFVRLDGASDYVYLGHYTQTRYSDRLDHDCIQTRVPTEVLLYWAEQLANRTRPRWVTDALIKHFWPQPEYTAQIPTPEQMSWSSPNGYGSSEDEASPKGKMHTAMQAYANELVEWKREVEMKAKLLTADSLMDSFFRSDSDTEPGLRLYWEYLQFVKFDDDFARKLENLHVATAVEKNVEAVGEGTCVEKEQQTSGRGDYVPPHLRDKGCAKR